MQFSMCKLQYMFFHTLKKEYQIKIIIQAIYFILQAKTNLNITRAFFEPHPNDFDTNNKYLLTFQNLSYLRKLFQWTHRKANLSNVYSFDLRIAVFLPVTSEEIKDLYLITQKLHQTF